MNDDSAFERMMARAARETGYPATPELRARVTSRIASERLRPARPRAWRPIVIATASAVAAVFAIVLAIPSSRSAVAEFFGVKGSEIITAPTPAPGTTPTPFPTPQGIEQAATPVALSAAEAVLGFSPPIPAGAGAPTRVYVVNYFNVTPVVVLGYERFDLWIANLDEGGVFQKTLGTETKLDTPLVGGRPANWIAGGAHIVTYIDAQGHEAAGARRTVTRNTLIWRSDRAFYRLETDLPEPDAIALAGSLP